MRSLLAQYLKNHLWEFCRIYKFGAVGTKVNWLDFEVKRSKDKVIVRPNVVR